MLVPPYLSGGQERTQGPRVVLDGAHLVLLHLFPSCHIEIPSKFYIAVHIWEEEREHGVQ